MINLENHSKRLKHLYQKRKATSISKEAKASSPKVQSFIYPFHHHSRPLFTKGKGRSIEPPKEETLEERSLTSIIIQPFGQVHGKEQSRTILSHLVKTSPKEQVQTYKVSVMYPSRNHAESNTLMEMHLSRARAKPIETLFQLHKGESKDFKKKPKLKT
ncbi:unnamed protein product [Cochlearia groenlandica]